MAKKKPAPKKPAQTTKQKPGAPEDLAENTTFTSGHVPPELEGAAVGPGNVGVSDEVVGNPDILETKKPYDARTDATKELPIVYGAKEPSIRVEDEGFYGGAHRYYLKNCVGWADGQTQYVDEETTIQFVKLDPDTNNITPGVQHQQLLMVGIDSLHKLGKKYPSPQTERAIRLLQQALACLDERVKERVNRNVMGELKA